MDLAYYIHERGLLMICERETVTLQDVERYMHLALCDGNKPDCVSLDSFSTDICLTLNVHIVESIS